MNPVLNLTDDDRERIIDQLRDEAIATCRNLGCTCQPEPAMALSERTFGPYDLPAWESDHPDGCPLSQQMQRALPGTERALIYDPQGPRP